MAFSVTFHQLIRKFPAFECQKHQWMPGCLFNKAYIFPRARCFRLCTLFAQFWIQNKANFHWKIRHFSKPMLELCGWHFDEEYCLINYTALWNCFLFVCLFLLRISQKLFNQSNRTWNHMFLKTWSLKLENEYSPFWKKNAQAMNQKVDISAECAQHCWCTTGTNIRCNTSSMLPS